MATAYSNVLTRKTRKGDTITFTYDTLTRLSTKAAPSEPTVTYTYDLAGRLIGASDTSAAITAAASPAGTLATASMTYDEVNRPLSFTFGPAPAQTAPTAGQSGFAYAYDLTNRRIGQTATDNTWWAYPTAASTVAYTANSLDQYTAIGAVTPTYDGNGNLTYDGTFTYHYDAESRLTSVTQGGTTVATYAYDPLGHRKAKTIGTTTTIYVSDAANRAVLDYDGTIGAVQRWYAFGASPNEVLSQMNVALSTRTTLIPDIQGSVVGSLDSSSGAITKAGYQPYGESGSTAGTFRYTGARIDAETNGLYDFRARMYSPTLGRFLQVDPIGRQGGMNLYAYTGNDPLNAIDPFGLTKSSQGDQFSAWWPGTVGFNPAPSQSANSPSIDQGSPWGFFGASTIALPGYAGSTAGSGVGGAGMGLGAVTSGLAGLALVGTTTSAGTPNEQSITFYHGTTYSSAVTLLGGAPVSAEAILQNTLNKAGAPTFFLATDAGDADYFASLHISPSENKISILQYNIQNTAIQSLVNQGATFGSIPQLGAQGSFQGQQLAIPSVAFPTFNALRAAGQITVSPYNIR